MLRKHLIVPALLVLLTGLTGCGSARLLQTTQDGGIVAIPSNTNYWPFYYRDEADRLMASRCPNGYEIVKEEEVVIGQQAITSESRDHKPGDGKKNSTDRTTFSSITTVTDQTEYRITFRKVPESQLTRSAVQQTSAVEPSKPGLPERPQAIDK